MLSNKGIRHLALFERRGLFWGYSVQTCSGVLAVCCRLFRRQNVSFLSAEGVSPEFRGSPLAPLPLVNIRFRNVNQLQRRLGRHSIIAMAGSSPSKDADDYGLDAPVQCFRQCTEVIEKDAGLDQVNRAVDEHEFLLFAGLVYAHGDSSDFKTKTMACIEKFFPSLPNLPFRLSNAVSSLLNLRKSFLKSSHSRAETVCHLERLLKDSWVLRENTSAISGLEDCKGDFSAKAYLKVLHIFNTAVKAQKDVPSEFSIDIDYSVWYYCKFYDSCRDKLTSMKSRTSYKHGLLRCLKAYDALEKLLGYNPTMIRMENELRMRSPETTAAGKDRCEDHEDIKIKQISELR